MAVLLSLPINVNHTRVKVRPQFADKKAGLPFWLLRKEWIAATLDKRKRGRARHT